MNLRPSALRETGAGVPAAREAEQSPPPTGMPAMPSPGHEAETWRSDLDVRQPVRSALVLITLATQGLPPRHRRRYEREFLAELYTMEPKEQVRYSASVFAETWHLNLVLRGRPATGPDED